MSDLIGNSKDRFSCGAAQVEAVTMSLMICRCNIDKARSLRELMTAVEGLVNLFLKGMQHKRTEGIVLMHQSFVSTAPLGPGNSSAFNFSVFKARLKAWHCGILYVVKSLLKVSAPRRLTIIWNNSW